MFIQLADTNIVNTGVDTLVDAGEIDGDVQPLPSRISQSSEQSHRSLIDDNAARVTRGGTSCQRGTEGEKPDYSRKFQGRSVMADYRKKIWSLPNGREG